jgi:hypothetical protein
LDWEVPGILVKHISDISVRVFPDKINVDRKSFSECRQCQPIAWGHKWNKGKKGETLV